MAGWKTLVLLSILWIQDADPERAATQLLRMLSADSVAEREKASKGLADLGPQILPLLETGIKSADAEVRFRIEDVLREIRRRQKVARWDIPSTLPGISIRDELLPTAFSRTFSPLGLRSHSPGISLGGSERRVCLSLKPGPFWEGLDAFVTAAQLKTVPSFDKGFLTLIADPSVREQHRHTLVGPFRLYAWVEPGAEGAGPPTLHLVLGRPPGSCLLSRTLAELQVIDGKTLLYRKEDGEAGTGILTRPQGMIGNEPLWRLTLPAENLRDTRTLSLSGTLAYSQPFDGESVEIDLTGFTRPIVKEVPGFRFTLTAVARDEKGGFVIEYDREPGAHASSVEEPTLLVWVEDKNGRASSSMSSFVGGGSGGGRIHVSPSEEAPTKLLLVSVLKQEKHLKQFSIPDVPTR